MVELEVWYDQVSENDFYPGDPAILLRSASGLDALIDRVQTETREHRVSAMVQMNIRGIEHFPVVSAGLGQTVGFLHYLAEDAGRTIGDGDPDATVEYTYCGSLNEIPADSEVPIDVVRQGLHEFMATGTRPSVVRDFF